MPVLVMRRAKKSSEGGKMTLAHNACANCLHIEGDTETIRRYLNNRWQEVYLHRCRKHPEQREPRIGGLLLIDNVQRLFD